MYRTATYGEGFHICCAFLLVVSDSVDKFKYHDFCNFLIQLGDDIDIEEIYRDTKETPTSADNKADLVKLMKKNKTVKSKQYLLKDVVANNQTEMEMENKLKNFLGSAKVGLNIIYEAIDNIINAIHES
eukprot:GAHX01000364.1.p1 GENE.GAHX01000364.1~~GAHX01000364.1.p1  ORF type:complete len:129 (-),score=30.97 GAHX01000364.1:62-448(-)